MLPPTSRVVPRARTKQLETTAFSGGGEVQSMRLRPPLLKRTRALAVSARRLTAGSPALAHVDRKLQPLGHFMCGFSVQKITRCRNSRLPKTEN